MNDEPENTGPEIDEAPVPVMSTEVKYVRQALVNAKIISCISQQEIALNRLLKDYMALCRLLREITPEADRKALLGSLESVAFDYVQNTRREVRTQMAQAEELAAGSKLPIEGYPQEMVEAAAVTIAEDMRAYIESAYEEAAREYTHLPLAMGVRAARNVLALFSQTDKAKRMARSALDLQDSKRRKAAAKREAEQS